MNDGAKNPDQTERTGDGLTTPKLDQDRVVAKFVDPKESEWSTGGFLVHFIGIVCMVLLAMATVFIIRWFITPHHSYTYGAFLLIMSALLIALLVKTFRPRPGIR